MTDVGIGNAPANFSFRELDGRTFIFEHERHVTDIGFSGDQDETFSLKFILGISPTETENVNRYTYFSVYKWNDNMGRVHYSQISNIINIATRGAIGEGDSPPEVSINTTYANMSEKDNIEIEIYRSIFVAGDLNQSNFRKVTTFNNLKSGNEHIFVDRVQDSDLTDNFLFFNIAQLPGGSIVASHNRRFYVSGGEFGNKLYFTREQTPEREEGLIFEVDRVQIFDGKIIGIQTLDASLLVFTDKYQYAFTIGADGSPPREPVPIHSLSNYQLTNKASIVRIPMGNMFQTRQGIQIILIGTEVKFIGHDIQSLKDLSVVDSEFSRENHEAYLRLEDGTLLVYNYLYNKWSQLRHDIVSAVSLSGRNYYLDKSGRLLVHSEETYSDSTIETGNFVISAEEVQSFMVVKRILLLGEFKDWEWFRISLAYNDSDNFEDERVVYRSEQQNRFGQPGTYGTQGQYAPERPEDRQIMIEPRRRKVYSIRIRLSIRSRSARLSNVSFESYVTNLQNITEPQQRL